MELMHAIQAGINLFSMLADAHALNMFFVGISTKISLSILMTAYSFLDFDTHFKRVRPYIKNYGLIGVIFAVQVSSLYFGLLYISTHTFIMPRECLLEPKIPFRGNRCISSLLCYTLFYTNL